MFWAALLLTQGAATLPPPTATLAMTIDVVRPAITLPAHFIVNAERPDNPYVSGIITFAA